MARTTSGKEASLIGELVIANFASDRSIFEFGSGPRWNVITNTGYWWQAVQLMVYTFHDVVLVRAPMRGTVCSSEWRARIAG